MIDECYNESCLDTMARFRGKSIDLILTSPPYDNMRTFGKYAKFDFTTIAKRFFRILKDGAVIVWVVGDQTKDGDESGTSFRQALFFKEIGFKLFDTMIYQKPLRAAIGSNRSYIQEFEYMFVFSKGLPKTINLIGDYRKKSPTKGNKEKRKPNGDIVKWKIPKSAGSNLYSRRGNIWRYAVGLNGSTKDKVAFEHPAIFPENLARDHIKTWTNEGDIVFDPFAGSGTTLKMARLLNRHFYGSEINPEYWNIIQKRLSQHDNQRLNDFMG